MGFEAGETRLCVASTCSRSLHKARALTTRNPNPRRRRGSRLALAGTELPGAENSGACQPPFTPTCPAAEDRAHLGLSTEPSRT